MTELKDANIEKRVLQSEIQHSRSQGVDPEDIMEKLVRSEHELTRTKQIAEENRSKFIKADSEREGHKAESKKEMERRIQAENELNELKNQQSFQIDDLDEKYTKLMEKYKTIKSENKDLKS